MSKDGAENILQHKRLQHLKDVITRKLFFNGWKKIKLSVKWILFPRLKEKLNQCSNNGFSCCPKPNSITAAKVSFAGGVARSESLLIRVTFLKSAPFFGTFLQHSVVDASSGELMGYFYLDLHPREGKYGHACVMPLQPGCINVQTGERQVNVCAMLANFSKVRKWLFTFIWFDVIQNYLRCSIDVEIHLSKYFVTPYCTDIIFRACPGLF